jgi:alkanesulfonate monooxygenase SsuD/methylene tetrahydromethanopterin reductase-like flavin-dependent oxidoreductase (luciferase family)
MAAATNRVRIGPMVTPIARRRPLKLAYEAATLDRYSRGRVTLGLGLGVNAGGELSRTGEELDPKTRGAMLDEGVPLLDKLLRGEHVVHRGAHYTVDGVTLTPTGMQQPRLPIWLAARGNALTPVRRAAKYEGVFLLANPPDRFQEIVECLRSERGTLEGFDVAILATPHYPLTEYERRGATWVVHSPFEAQALTTDARTSSVYNMHAENQVDHAMSMIESALR